MPIGERGRGGEVGGANRGAGDAGQQGEGRDEGASSKPGGGRLGVLGFRF